MRYWLEKPTMQDVASLAPRVAEAEAQEVQALSGQTVQAVLAEAVLNEGEYGHYFYALHCSDGVLGMGGCRPGNVLGTWAVPWFLGQDMQPHRRWLMCHSRIVVQECLGAYPLLMNVVGAWNSTSIAWLKHTGFVVEEDKPLALGRNGEEFYEFWITRRS